MALQKINWTQIDTANVPSGSTVTLGTLLTPLDGVHTDTLFIAGSDFFSYLTGYTPTGWTIDTGSFATTGSNIFHGTEIISGSLRLQAGSGYAIESNRGILITSSIGEVDILRNLVYVSGSIGKSTLAQGYVLIEGSNDMTGNPQLILASTNPAIPETIYISINSRANEINPHDGPAISQYTPDNNVHTIIGFQCVTGFTNGDVTFYTPTIMMSGLTLTGSIDITGQYLINGYPISGGTGSGIWIATGSFFAANENLQVTGSQSGLMNSPDGTVLNKYALTVSQSVHAFNINVGTPSSNDWQTNLSGSYFNNFNKNTDVSEILRFIAGLLSSSAPDAAPNTRIYSGFTSTGFNNTTGTVTAGRIPLNSTNSTINYLSGKGFAVTGSTIFNGISTIYNNPSYYESYTSVPSGTTAVSSSVNTFGLGNLVNGSPTSFHVSGSFSFRFENNNSGIASAVSSSQELISQISGGTTNGVYLGSIPTVNPTVIPPAYQDGKFTLVFPQYIYNGGYAAVSSSGYYYITSSIRIASGSSPYTSPTTNYTRIFYAPLSTISTNIGNNSVSTSDISVTRLTATSRSLSGAPYLQGATYRHTGSLYGLFNPMYHAGVVANVSLSGTGVGLSGGVNSISLAGGTIQTANAVYDSTGAIVRIVGSIPYETDMVKLSGDITFVATGTNITESGLGTKNFTSNLNGTDKNGLSVARDIQSIEYHTAGTFGQPVASGSLAYYGYSQGYDGSPLSGNSITENFSGETYRIILNNNILPFNGGAWNTSFILYNLGGDDLQVKPGFLVSPNGVYGYWYTDPDPLKTYKYYVRRFKTNGTTKTSMTLNLNRALVNWGATTNNAIGAIILFKSSNSGIYSPARLYDPSNLLDNFTATKTAGTDGQNPFSSNFDLYGNTGGSLGGTTYTIPIRNADGMILNATYDELYLIVRYHGSPQPITSINVTFS